MSRPIVLLTQSLDAGGSERQLAELAISLDRDAFHPTVACFDRRGMRASQLERAGIPVVEFPVRSFRSPATARIALSFCRWLRRSRVDLVHAFDVPTALFAVPLARVARVPAVLSSQRGDRRLFPALFQRALRVTDRLSNVVVVNSDYVGRVLTNEFGIAAAKLCTCRNGIDLTTFRPDGPSNRATLPRGAFVVGVVTVLRPEKSIETLIDAFARLDDRAILVIVGDGPSKEMLRARAARLGLGARCRFVPATAAVAPWYRAFDVFVLPSLNESFSNSLMEAMACGCASVASNVGGNPELVRHGDNGLLFTAGDPVDLAGQIETLSRDADERARLARAAARTVEHAYSARRSARRFAALYQDVLAREPLSA